VALQSYCVTTLAGNFEVDNFGTGKTILLVEDETFVREAMAAALRSSGYVVLIAADGAQAFEACLNYAQPIDLLLSDTIMPKMSGNELAGKFRAIHPQASILLMSGHAEELMPYKSFPHHWPCLRKPFSVDALIKAIGEVLHAREFASRASTGKL
jgi:two-component system, cell cycle sensor histidine kinase and response regulator CckA